MIPHDYLDMVIEREKARIAAEEPSAIKQRHPLPTKQDARKAAMAVAAEHDQPFDEAAFEAWWAGGR